MKKIATAVMTCALIGAAAGVALAPAADAAPGRCPSGRSCIWEDLNYKTNGDAYGYYATNNYDAHLGSKIYRGTGDDVVGDTGTSISNNGTVTMNYYLDASCNGDSLAVRVGVGIPDLRARTRSGGTFDQDISSASWSGYYSTCRNS